PATFVATATACPRTRATVFPAFLTVFLTNRVAICPPWLLACAPAVFARLTACSAAFLIFAMCCSPDRGLLDQLRHELQRSQRIIMRFSAHSRLWLGAGPHPRYCSLYRGLHSRPLYATRRANRARTEGLIDVCVDG